MSSRPAAAPCPAQLGVIDDIEDNDNQIAVASGRNGYWFSYVDDAGSEVWPESGDHGGRFEMSPGGAGGSEFAARFKGSTGTGKIVFAGAGLGFVESRGPYDARRFRGISFWAKKGPGSTDQVRLRVPDKTTAPAGGICGECFNDFGINLTLTGDWQKYTVPFSVLEQQDGWGEPTRARIDQSAIYGLQFQAMEPGQAFDIWIDELQFTGCGTRG